MVSAIRDKSIAPTANVGCASIFTFKLLCSAGSIKQLLLVHKNRFSLRSRLSTKSQQSFFSLDERPQTMAVALTMLLL